MAGQLAGLGYAAACLNGDMAQGERNRVMNAFREGGVKILVATDVAARGIDVAEVDAVINYDVPTSNEYYTHRIGRTGRARRVGESFLLYMNEERLRVRDMLRYTKSTATEMTVTADGQLVQAEGQA